MTTKRIVWQAPDGSIKVTVPAGQPLPGEPEQMYLDRLALMVQNNPGMAGCVRLPDVDQADLPANRRWRNQWRWEGGRIQPAVELCRQQRMAEIREERNQRLKQSDGEMLRLNEINVTPGAQTYKDYRQHLRDLPATAQSDLATKATPDECAAYNPTWPVEH